MLLVELFHLIYATLKRPLNLTEANQFLEVFFSLLDIFNSWLSIDSLAELISIQVGVHQFLEQLTPREIIEKVYPESEQLGRLSESTIESCQYRQNNLGKIIELMNQKFVNFFMRILDLILNVGLPDLNQHPDGRFSIGDQLHPVCEKFLLRVVMLIDILNKIFSMSHELFILWCH